MARNSFRALFGTILATIALIQTASTAPARSGAFAYANRHYRATVDARGFRYFSHNNTLPDLEFRLDSVTIGSEKRRITRPPTIQAGARLVSCAYGDWISETYIAAHRFVEQCWLIRLRPRTSGGITVSGRLSSPHKAVSSSDGLSFMDGRGRVVLNYSKVTAIDSAGRKFHTAPKLSGNRLTIALPESFIKTAKFPILIDPVVGSELPIGPTYGAAPKIQEDVEIASSPYGFFAVWRDSRGTNGTDIFGCRISPTGEVLDPQSIAISTAPGNQTHPSIAWNGQEYLVVWADERAGSSHIYACRVRWTGEVIDKQGMLVSSSTGTQAYARVASDGVSWQVVWQNVGTSGSDIYGAKVNGDGSIGRIVAICARPDSNEEMPDIAWNGVAYLVVWCDHRNSTTTGSDIYAHRVARNGFPMTGSDTLVSCLSDGVTGAARAQRAPRLCSYGSNYFVVWEDCRDDTVNNTSNIYGARVNSLAVVLDKGGICINNASGDQEMPSVGYSGSNLLVAWRDGTDRIMRGCRVSSSGSVLDPSGFVISSGMAGAFGGSVAAVNGVFIVGWSSLQVTQSDCVSGFVYNDGSVPNPAGNIISLALEDQQYYSVARNGNQYAVVWSRLTNGVRKIMGARVSETGQVLAGPSDLLPGYPVDVSEPSIAWGGTQYLLVWKEPDVYGATDIRGWRLDANLNRVGGPITVCAYNEQQASPFVVSNGNNFLVTWEDSRNAVSPNYYTDLYGAIVNASGAVTLTSAPITLATGNQRRPRAASDGTNFLVVWEDWRKGYPLVYGTRVTSAGAVQDTNGIAIPSATYPSYSQVTPDICYGGGNYLCAWSEFGQIRACRVTAAGVCMDVAGITVSAATTHKTYPNPCWDGSKYQVVWEDARSSYTGNLDIYHQTVSTAGVPSTNPECALVSCLDPELRPAVMASGTSGMLFYLRNHNYANMVCSATLTEQSPQYVASIAEAKAKPQGTPVALQEKVVTAVFPECFYIEDLDRLSGIKVISSVPVNRNDLVDVTGPIILSDGERAISANTVVFNGTTPAPLEPLGIRGEYLGGASMNAYTPGVTGGYGPHNVGLLVATWGKVTSVGSDYFYIEPRAGMQVKVRAGSLAKPAVGKIVGIVGISTCEINAGAVCRVIRPRTQADIRVFK
jgi:hypothetical protein